MSIPKDFPPIVYVPLAEATSDVAEARLQYRTTKDGRKALLAYSALDRLRDGMGASQPWAVFPTLHLQAFWDADRFDTVLLDLVVPPGLRVGPEGDAARAATGGAS